jgi:hypothetical protein
MNLKVYSKQKYGWLWHYHHFLTDFLLPFFKATVELRRRNTLNKVYLQNGMEQSIGNFKTHFGNFFDVKVETVSPEVFWGLDLPLISLTGMRRNIFSDNDFENVIRFLESKWELYDPTYPHIILIERKKQKLVFGDRNGAERRRVKNHASVNTMLNKNFDKVANLSLEKIPFDQQVKYFYNAKVVIGQHGAGLSNMLLQRNGCVIEFISKFTRSDFWNPYLWNKKIKWIKMPCMTQGTLDNEEMIVNLKQLKDIVGHVLHGGKLPLSLWNGVGFIPRQVKVL